MVRLSAYLPLHACERVLCERQAKKARRSDVQDEVQVRVRHRFNNAIVGLLRKPLVNLFWHDAFEEPQGSPVHIFFHTSNVLSHGANLHRSGWIYRMVGSVDCIATYCVLDYLLSLR
jgi:hypothetical protein